MCSALGPSEDTPFERVYFKAFVTFKHPQTQQHTKKWKISGHPGNTRNKRNRCFFLSLGYCDRISRHWRASFQNGHGVLTGSCLQTQFWRCCGISVKHNVDTTRHVFCSRSIGISFERYVSGCIQRQAFVTFKYSQSRGHTKKPKISGCPDYMGGIGPWRCFAHSWQTE